MVFYKKNVDSKYKVEIADLSQHSFKQHEFITDPEMMGASVKLLWLV